MVAVALIVVGVFVLLIGYALTSAGVYPKCSRCRDPLPHGFEHTSKEYGTLCRACTREVGARPWYAQDWMWKKMQAEAKAKE